jgi:putative flippase GtrA
VRRQGLRYLLVGAWNTVFGYGLFATLQLTLGHHIHYLVLLVVATVVSTLQAFVLYRTWVFEVEGPWLPDLGRFSLVYLGAFLANLVLLPVLVEAGGLPVLAAQALVVGGTVIASFLAHRNFSFRRPPSAQPPA